MKKLFTLALGTLMVIGLAACGKQARAVDSFDDTVIKNGDAPVVLVGPTSAYVDGKAIPKGWGEADGTFGVSTASSLRDVAKHDVELAEKLEAKKDNIKGLYRVEKVQLGHYAKAGYMKGAYNEKGEYVEADGCYTVKFNVFTYDDELEKYVLGGDSWLPSPEIHSESLSPKTLWVPGHDEQPDAHGLAHDSDQVNIGGPGEYTYFVAFYKKAQNGAMAGLAAVKDQELTEYVPPVKNSDYALPGEWNSWDNGAYGDIYMHKVNDTTYECTLELAAASTDGGRVVKAETWDTVAGASSVTTGADLITAGNDDNILFKAAGTYKLTLTLTSATAGTLAIVQQ